MEKNFNIIIRGVGGQGLITLLSVIDEAAFIEGNDVRSSELHGLSQRGGSVQAHIRFGKKVNSPLVMNGRVDLVISLEMLEGLRETAAFGKNTKFLINKNSLPLQDSLKPEEIELNLKSSVKNNLYLVPASQVCKEKLQNEVVATLYLLGVAVYKKLIPLSEESVIKAIKVLMPEKYRELNINAFKLAKTV